MILASRPWHAHLAEVLNGASEHVLVASPYISTYGATFLTDHLTAHVRDRGRMTVLTDLSPASVAQGSTDVAAVLSLAQACADVQIVHLSRLHAKVYVADAAQAIVSSGNLTYGGLRANFEYGVCLSNPADARQVHDDLLGYAVLGTPVHEDLLRTYADLVPELRAPGRSATLTAEQQQAQDAARALLQSVHDVPEGAASYTAVFGNAVLHVLRREGPLATTVLHNHVRTLLPDLCDDAEDRVINGRHFGKLWKHRVRIAQYHLKRRGVLKLAEGIWSIA